MFSWWPDNILLLLLGGRTLDNVLLLLGGRTMYYYYLVAGHAEGSASSATYRSFAPANTILRAVRSFNWISWRSPEEQLVVSHIDFQAFALGVPKDTMAIPFPIRLYL